jgi:hypothetical protein
MKNRRVLPAFLLLGLFAAITWQAIDAQTDEYQKNYNKEYPVTKNTQLQIQNKFGNVDIINWNKSLISIKAVVKVWAKNKDDADKLLSYINVNFSQDGDIVKAITDINNDINKKFGFNWNNKKMEINYTVNMPENVPLALSVKYGNAFINKLTSTSTIDIKYGKLKANSIIHTSEKPLTEITLGYSEGTIEDCQWLKMDLKYSKIQITKSKALLVVSKYSKVYVDEGSSIVSESKYDTYKIGTLSNFVTISGYSNFSFNQISNKIEVETRYSDFKVQKVPATFESISINNQYGNYRIGVDPDASYKIDGDAKYAHINFPDEGRVNKFNENNEEKVNGTVGNNPNPKATVKITTRYGSVNLED